MQVAQTVKGINPQSIAWERTLVRKTAAGTNVNHTFPNKQLEISALVPALSEPRLIAIGLSDMDAESSEGCGCYDSELPNLSRCLLSQSPI